jgi:pantetheine-phosphate adenylyltransferase
MKVLYSGSFSPWHYAHQYVYDVACKCFGKENVWLGVGVNKEKPASNRDIKFSLVPITNNVIVYQGLTAKVVKDHGFDILIRGIRPGKSLEQEESLLHWNRELCGIETILIPTPPELNQISSSVIRELDSESIDVSKYMNMDVFNRWKNGSPKKTIYFGRTCSGKSTYLKNNRIPATDCDKIIWDFVVREDKSMLKTQFTTAFINKHRPSYDIALYKIGSSIDWKSFFMMNDFFDAAVIGLYWDFIPVEVRAQFAFYKVETSQENRNKFAECRKVSDVFLSSADFFYKDPPYWDHTITIEDIE